MKKYNLAIGLSLISILVLLAQTEIKKGDLSVIIKGFKTIKGRVELKLYQSEQDYDDGNYFKKMDQAVNGEEVRFDLTGLPYGEYAIGWHHDANSNGEFDTNFFGKPIESYGFSNNAKATFGPASWEEARFKLDRSKIQMNLRVDY